MELVKVYEYELDRDIIEKCTKEGRNITSKDVETDIHKILKDNFIECKNKIVDRWITKGKIPDYISIVEIYVYETNKLMAEKLINEYINS